MNNKRFLIHHTYDVFVKCDGPNIEDTKLVMRELSHIMSDVFIDDDGFVTRWLYPNDHDYVYSGTIRAPLAWLSGVQLEVEGIINEQTHRS